jgi:LemA protein
VNVLAIVAAPLAVLVLATVVSFNRFVGQQQLVRNSWANVDTELQRRHELVPNLVETARGYAAHERTTFEEVITARQIAHAVSGAPARQIGPENLLTQGLRHLIALAEAYPELRASAHFLELHRQLVSTENRIQAARRVYNGNVRDLNRRIESVPSNLVAAAFGFEPAHYVELDATAEARTVPGARL